ncbi:hypothetical protein BRYFOR_07421 [Marvinbryantia formatexigens DSM 14469]|uniref:Alpha/beta hydrolase fold-3 domain-containing protein n=1 Tax=Marvinbryantia formatexigens DSM 14469 TaxID=478749 RepID=C6LFL8_9FIRM|nr:alpha/beta hydrolase [Marvinbryantia formatexigens]EET60603.1 hypothetical protein BRYFOR_07421 [Marvinbryantia formatexigens DSM 14469]UWO25593.1 alpha/beta hydrolase [Marvinbryantia formatexigens DSM 14469]SDG18332.1 Acetyl esterase/lipase [Marvinbryantia formatexigens]
MSSIQMEAVRMATAAMTNEGLPSFDEDINPEKLRAAVETAQAAMPLQEGVTYEETTLGGMEAELSMPSYAREDALILYIHGGGLVCGNARTSRGYAGMLAGESRIPVYAFSYGLAPENPYPAAVEECFKAYCEALEKHPDIPVFLIGESGGALLSIATALKIRDEKIRMPAGVIAYSPVIDMSGTLDHSNYGWDENTVTAAGLKSLAKLYCPDESRRKEPYASPLFADYKDYCPLYVVWDRGETLAVDGEELVRLAMEARVPVEYDRYEGCFHAFAPVGRNTPESSKLLDDTIAFIYRHIHDQKLDFEE